MTEVEERAAVGLDQKPYRLAALEQSVSFDRRDQPLDSRKGVYAAVTLNEGGAALGGALPFVRVTGDLRGYLPLGQRFVLAARTFYGRRLGSNFLPVTERFFDGGANGHRGFAFRRLSPYVRSEYPPTPTADDPTPDPAPANLVQTAPIGGDQDFLGSGEVRFDVGKIKSYPFGLVGFVDAGDAICDLPTCLPSDALDFTNLHWAAGIGARWNPVISLRVDVGYRLNRYQAGEPDAGEGLSPLARFAFHISVGQAF
jgi:translocation and assembly module TamA